MWGCARPLFSGWGYAARWERSGAHQHHNTHKEIITITKPYSILLAPARFWNTLDESLTSTYSAEHQLFPTGFRGQIKLSLVGSTFSGTINLQVSADGTNWINIPYFRSDTAPLGSLNTDQISLVGSSATQSYVVPGGPFNHFRVVMTRTAGTITASLEGYEHDSPLAVGDSQKVATAIWAEPARTLTDFSAEKLFDLPELTSPYPYTTLTSSVSANVFGSWVEIIADVGVGKRLIAATWSTDLNANQANQVEFGEGASGSEIAITRATKPFIVVGTGAIYPIWSHDFWRSLTDNARLSVRVKDDLAAGKNYFLTVQVA